jgi:hypothetical protein
MLVIVMAVVWPFFSVSFCGELDVPRSWFPKERMEGERVTVWARRDWAADRARQARSALRIYDPIFIRTPGQTAKQNPKNTVGRTLTRNFAREGERGGERLVSTLTTFPLPANRRQAAASRFAVA